MKLEAGWIVVAAVAAAGALAAAGTAEASAKSKASVPKIVIGADGETAPAFSYANAIRERVFIPVPGVDQDGDGITDNVAADIVRPAETAQGMKVPAIIDASPYYTSIGRGNEGEFIHTSPSGIADGMPLFYDNYFVPRGYAFIAAQAVGTAFSTGCPLHGGPGDVAGFKAVIDWLRGRVPGYTSVDDTTPVTAGWNNGKNAMIGKSYDGTFANGVAATGVEGLTTIVPISAISDWYDYSRMGGIRFNTHYPASLSSSITQLPSGNNATNLTLLGVLPPEHNAHCAATRTAMSATGESGDGDSNGDIDAFWQDRNYNLNVDKVHASVFASHGLADDNVKLNHFSQWWAGLAAHHVERKVWLHQLGHVDPFDYRRAEWVDTLHRWFDYWLYGVKNGIMKEPMADIEVAPNTWTTAKSWPVPHTKPVDVYLQGTVVGAKGALGLRSGGETTSLTFTDANLSENNYLSLTNTQANKLMFLSPPLTHDLRISGTPLIDIRASLSTTQTNLSAFLVDYGPGDVLRVNRTSDGAQNLTTTSCWADPTQCAAPCPAAAVDNDPCYLDVIERTTTTSGGQTIPFKPTTWRVSKGILDSSNRDSLFSGFGLDALIGQTYEFAWPTLPNDFTFVAGHQVGIVIGTNFSGYGSVNGTTQTAVTLDTKLSKVTLPIVGGGHAARASGAFDGRPGVDLEQPAEGSTFTVGQVVTAKYKCSPSEVPVATCVGNVPNGSPIDTSTAGPQTFTVTATDVAGGTTTVTTHYTVA